MAGGTLGIGDLLRTNNQTILKFGEDRVFEAIQILLAAHNEQMTEMVDDLVEASTDRARRYGTTTKVDLDQIDEVGIPDAQKDMPAGINVGFPLRRYGISLQWTRDWFTWHTVAELASQVQDRQDADARRMIYEVKKALFVPTNYTFHDRFYDDFALDIYRLVNADGKAIPPAWDGTTFDGSSHTHYLARAGGAVASSDVQALLDTVIEHYNVGQSMLYINRAQEAAIRAMTDKFTPYTDARLVQPVDVTRAEGVQLDFLRPTNRAIGVFDAAEVWVKPWIPSGYMFSWMKGGQKPLVLRNPEQGAAGLNLVYQWDSFPLRAESLTHSYGLGVWHRNNGAILYTGNTVYAAPTLTL